MLCNCGEENWRSSTIEWTKRLRSADEGEERVSLEDQAAVASVIEGPAGSRWFQVHLNPVRPQASGHVHPLNSTGSSHYIILIPYIQYIHCFIEIITEKVRTCIRVF
jgi:hypothetical protein